ncbi:flagellar export chaperone FliS [Sphingomonas japonica]|uniref:Flagellar protein FliS n=1 Tax=Sphingomonas japonica TaxID=511662 RepID=A0ABX0U3D5_9SPHN|nr:flagellar protein FliS [Sphingomonas japonica]NIJ23817.1 flagellar protein FliS [Sphingomonas japonica]
MARYASALLASPEATYRSIDLAGRTGGADGHALVDLLYAELIRALGVAAWATEHRDFKLKGERITRAIAILFALENGLDFERGGEVSRTLATLYAGTRQSVIDASVGQDPAPLRIAAANIAEIADAWRQLKAA